MSCHQCLHSTFATMHIFAYLGIKFHIAEEPDQESDDNCFLQAIRRDAVPHIWHLSATPAKHEGKIAKMCHYSDK